MYFITTKRMLEVCFSVHPNIQYRTLFICRNVRNQTFCMVFLDAYKPENPVKPLILCPKC